MQKHTTPDWMLAQGFSETFADRFWSKVQMTDGCWLWVGAIKEKGYGTISSGPAPTKHIRAHVASWMLHKGPVPDGLCVLHNCPDGDNPGCVKPDHLWTGTTQENSRDMREKGRSLVGEKNIHAKLTAPDVLKIRSLYATGVARQKDLAHSFKVSVTAISAIVNRKYWKHLRDTLDPHTTDAPLPQPKP